MFRLPYEKRLDALTPSTRAALWMLVGGFCAVLMNVLTRIAAERMHPFEVSSSAVCSASPSCCRSS
jgi:hypothetical protein